ncbi:hypothetical protein JW926_06475 [Candidatus Sumerlaeota bacterium]|nr:hypothetical protein [Candidatus Sumerlaeota bacterium]
MAISPIPQDFKEFLKLLEIEIQTDISGVEFDTCFSRRRRVDMGGIEVNLIDLEDLKKNKRESGRHKDLEDLERLP